VDGREYCAEIGRAAGRLQESHRPQAAAAVSVRPGARLSPRLLAAPGLRLPACRLVACGFPGRRTSERDRQQQRMLQKALREVRSGDILLAHSGHLVAQGPVGAGGAGAPDHGLKSRGFCFATLREHPCTASGWRAVK
jgi:hypothetical protein